MEDRLTESRGSCIFALIGPNSFAWVALCFEVLGFQKIYVRADLLTRARGSSSLNSIFYLCSLTHSFSVSLSLYSTAMEATWRIIWVLRERWARIP